LQTSKLGNLISSLTSVQSDVVRLRKIVINR
jgi:hypothetical protein